MNKSVRLFKEEEVKLLRLNQNADIIAQVTPTDHFSKIKMKAKEEAKSVFCKTQLDISNELARDLVASGFANQ